MAQSTKLVQAKGQSGSGGTVVITWEEYTRLLEFQNIVQKRRASNLVYNLEKYHSQRSKCECGGVRYAGHEKSKKHQKFVRATTGLTNQALPRQKQ